MPEGPEVRKFADALQRVLSGREICSLEARTRGARRWLEENELHLRGRRIERVISHGKHLLGYIEGNFFFHSHLMMWGRWLTYGPVKRNLELPERDRRERARVVVNGGAAVMLSAPIFNVGKGDPYKQIENLATLGPDALPYDRKFDDSEFRRRLLSANYRGLPTGAALLNQQIVAGLGNYLRAEILFACRINPWRPVKELSAHELNCLSRQIPLLTRRSYRNGATATRKQREMMAADSSLVYQTGREMGTRHLVFRRTNLPCLRCGEKIRQLRQATYASEVEGQDERTRIIYFCPRCQKVTD